MTFKELPADSYLKALKRHCTECCLLPPEEECPKCTDRRMHLVVKHKIPPLWWAAILKGLRRRKEGQVGR